MPEAFRFQVNSEVWKDEAPGDISINPRAATPSLNNSDGSGFAPIFPDICYHLTHYKHAAADIPVASDNPAHYADA
ncbi:hypothetical protein UL79_15875, partial [Shigella dysenteriae]|uniref:hypothetical protein n=1 Tax=Shigella dysenteriae TaxID=622 RepID=UPI000EDC57F8